MTDQERAVMQQALEALEAVDNDAHGTAFPATVSSAITDLLAALAEPTQEPVAWMVYTEDGKSVCVTDNPNDLVGACRALPLYTAPPQRPPLTDEEIAEATAGVLGLPHEIKVELARAVERKVRGE